MAAVGRPAPPVVKQAREKRLRAREWQDVALRPLFPLGSHERGCEGETHVYAMPLVLQIRPGTDARPERVNQVDRLDGIALLCELDPGSGSQCLQQ